MYLDPVHPADGSTEQEKCMHRSDKKMLNKILFSGSCADYPLTAAALRTIEGSRVAFDVSCVRYRHDHIFAGNQILVGEISRLRDDLGAPFIGKAGAQIS